MPRGPHLGRLPGADVAEVLRFVLEQLDEFERMGRADLAKVRGFLTKARTERESGWPGLYELMNGLGWLYGVAAARVHVEPLLRTAAEGDVAEEASRAAADLRSLAGEAQGRMERLDPSVLLSAFEELREQVPAVIDPQAEVEASLTSYGGRAVYFRDFHWNVLTALHSTAEWLERLVFYEARPELVIFRGPRDARWFEPAWLARLGPEERREMTRRALREASALARRRTWYGTRREAVPEDAFGTVLRWANGPAAWLVDWGWTRTLPLVSRGGQRDIQLDANEILVPFPAALVAPVAPYVDPLPLYEMSLESKERDVYPVATVEWVRRAIRSAVDAALPGEDSEERALLAIEWFENFQADKAKPPSERKAIKAFLYTFRPWPGLARGLERWLEGEER